MRWMMLLEAMGRETPLKDFLMEHPERIQEVEKFIDELRDRAGWRFDRYTFFGSDRQFNRVERLEKAARRLMYLQIIVEEELGITTPVDNLPL